jgi:hypothetical protein
LALSTAETASPDAVRPKQTSTPCIARTCRRALAYEALALFSSALSAPAAASSRALRDKPQLEALLSYVRNGVSAPLQRLPAAAAALAAEASLLLRAPGAAAHGYVRRLLLRAPAADFGRLPWTMRLLAAGAQHHRADRQWLLRMMWLGLRVRGLGLRVQGSGFRVQRQGRG